MRQSVASSRAHIAIPDLQSRDRHALADARALATVASPHTAPRLSKRRQLVRGACGAVCGACKEPLPPTAARRNVSARVVAFELLKPNHVLLTKLFARHRVPGVAVLLPCADVSANFFIDSHVVGSAMPFA